MIRKHDAIQPIADRKLRDARAESDPFIGTLPGDRTERLLIHWSYQASDSDRHWCLGAASAFYKPEA